MHLNLWIKLLYCKPVNCRLMHVKHENENISVTK